MIAVTLFAATSSSAKDNKSSGPLKFSIAANAEVPTSAGYSGVFGADLQADFGIANSTSVTGSVGYQNYKVKSTYGVEKFYMIPLLAGVKSYLGNDKFYGHTQLVFGFGKSGVGSFAYAPGIGYYFNENFDTSIKYLALSNTGTLGTVGVRLAYSF